MRFGQWNRVDKHAMYLAPDGMYTEEIKQQLGREISKLAEVTFTESPQYFGTLEARTELHVFTPEQFREIMYELNSMRYCTSDNYQKSKIDCAIALLSK